MAKRAAEHLARLSPSNVTVCWLFDATSCYLLFVSISRWHERRVQRALPVMCRFADVTRSSVYKCMIIQYNTCNSMLNGACTKVLLLNMPGDLRAEEGMGTMWPHTMPDYPLSLKRLNFECQEKRLSTRLIGNKLWNLKEVMRLKRSDYRDSNCNETTLKGACMSISCWLR